MLQGPSLRWGKSPYKHPGRFLGTGNRCGHSPEKGEFDRYNAPQTARKLPSTQQKLIEAARAYYYSPASLPSLSNLNGRANADGQPRSNRSDGRAAEALVLCAIIQQTEFSSLKVGTPRPDGGFIPRSCRELAQIAGLTVFNSNSKRPEPSQRFWRAFRRLKLAGAFTVHQQYEERPDGSKRARPAIKHVSDDFLVALGAVGYAKLKEFRSWCSNRLKKAKKKHREQSPEAHDAADARRKVLQEQNDKTGLLARLTKNLRGPRDVPDADAEKESQRQYNVERNAYQAQIEAQNPGAAPEMIRQLVNIKFPPYRTRRKE